MKDSGQGMFLATLVAAPVVIVCCGAGTVLFGSIFGGLVGWFSGGNLLWAALGTTLLGIAVLARKSYLRAHHSRVLKENK